MSNLPAPGVYNIDSVHSHVGFSVRHLVAAKVRGEFTEYSGTVTVGDSPETSVVDATVSAASITTNNDMRDGHLKSADFLDLENHPNLTFKSTSIKPKGENYVMTGDLTIRGVTKSVDFDLEFLGTGPSAQPAPSTAPTPCAVTSHEVPILPALRTSMAMAGTREMKGLMTKAIVPTAIIGYRQPLTRHASPIP